VARDILTDELRTGEKLVSSALVRASPGKAQRSLKKVFGVLMSEMYQWRKMNECQREEILRDRQDGGRPWHSPPHFGRESNIYLLTGACYEHKPLMSRDARRDEWASDLLEAFNKADADVRAWVVLPNHWHVLATVALPKFNLDMDAGLDELAFENPHAATEDTLLADAKNYLQEKKAIDNLQQKIIEKIRKTGSSPEKRKKLKEQLLDSGFSKNDWDELLLISGIITNDTNGGDGTGAVETLNRLRREVDALVAHGETIAAGKCSHAMASILESIEQEVARLASQTKGHVTTLVGKVDADRETIALVEKDARARGIGLNLSRDELLESLAEINQELAQSLTVVSSVTDILTCENVGAMNQAQHDILKIAADGVDKIHKLATYMGNLSGVPASLSPDREILDEAYNK